MDTLASDWGWSRSKFKLVAAVIFVVVFGVLAVPLATVCCINGFCPHGRLRCSYDFCTNKKCPGYNPPASGEKIRLPVNVFM